VTRTFAPIIPFTLIALLWPGVASAHGVRVSVTVSNEAITGSARFADGSPMAEAVVELRDPNKSAEGPARARSRTNTEGRFAFPAPRERGEFLVTVDDGIGHRGEARFTLLIDRVIAGDAPHTHRPEHPPWREWLSGLGYLLGLVGITAWWLARRRPSSSQD
jgi:nickel transport protein